MSLLRWERDDEGVLHGYSGDAYIAQVAEITDPALRDNMHKTHTWEVVGITGVGCTGGQSNSEQCGKRACARRFDLWLQHAALMPTRQLIKAGSQ